MSYPACIGCGYCCKKVQCGLSVRLYGVRSYCPALEYRRGRYWCRHAASCGILLDIGAGCCSTLNSDRRELLRKERENHERKA